MYTFLFQVSIGTGAFCPKIINPPTGLISWSSSIIDILFSASSKYDMKNLNKISKFENLKHFYRLDLELDEDIGLDDYNAFDKMDQIFEKWLEINKEHLDKICLELVS